MDGHGEEEHWAEEPRLEYCDGGGVVEREEKVERNHIHPHPVLAGKGEMMMMMHMYDEMYKVYFSPIVTYAADTWTMTKRDESRLQAAEMKFLRSMLQKTSRKK